MHCAFAAMHLWTLSGFMLEVRMHAAAYALHVRGMAALFVAVLYL
jgi:hypothetical protein